MGGRAVSLDMACIELVELVTDYLEGALSAEDVARVERHLADCEDCEAYVAQMRVTIEQTGRLEPEDVPAPVLDALGDAFRRRFGR